MLKLEAANKKDITLLLIIAGISGFLMYGLGFFVIGLIPLQFLASKQLRTAFFLALLVLVIIGFILFLLRFLAGNDPDLLTFFLLPLTLFLAIFVLNVKLFEIHLDAWIRISIAGLLTMFGTTGNLFFADASIVNSLVSFFEDIPELLSFFSVIAPSGSLEEQVRYIISIALRMAYLSSTIMLLISYTIGRLIASGRTSVIAGVQKFRLPSELVWVVIASLVTGMFAELFGILVLAYIGWNTFLVTSLLYSILGLSIILTRMQNRSIVFLFLIIAMFIPILNVISFIVLVILGISSIWMPSLHNHLEREGIENESDT